MLTRKAPAVPLVPLPTPLHCSHRPACPGCPRFGEGGLAPSASATLQELARKNGLAAPEVIEGARANFRHRARLSIRGRAHNPKLGIFQEGTHQLVHIPDCQIHHPTINEVARRVRRSMVAHALPPYSDVAHAGTARALQVVVDRASGRAQVVLITNTSSPAGLEPFLATLQRELEPYLHSFWWNGNPERTNALLGARFERLSGPETLVDESNGVRVHYPPGAFGQSNLPLASLLASRIAAFVPEQTRVLELYAGVGAIGLPLAARCSHLAMNELSEHGLSGLRRGIAELAPELAERIAIHPGAAGDAAARVAEADIVIVDPPRKGLDRALLQALIASPPQRLLYASCGLPALLSESDELVASGAFELTHLEAYALFPFTEHVETLAVFERPGSLPA
jgi:tRNA/tmRNA/rRNA uracil-C5-methylase (TrmA/RlmC/RlmD family)